MDRREIIERLTEDYGSLSPQLQQAAKAILDQPEEVALASMRGMAGKAGVAPATMLRLARSLGFDSYESLRGSFQQALRGGGEGFAGRAEWLQQVAAEGDSGRVLSEMAAAQIRNLESAYRQIDPEALSNAADCLRNAEQAYVLGVAGLHGLMRHFHFVCRFALPQVRLVESDNSGPIDGLLHLCEKDALLAISVAPYGQQTVEAVSYAREQGAKVLVVTDSRSSPIASLADHLLLLPTESPQFFPSMTAALALLESLMALIVSRGDRETVATIERTDRLRREKGVYWGAR
jgi:DNA-binding MurR/RpiR family transcriptional regulator